MKGVWAGVALGAAVVLGLLVVVLSGSRQRDAGTNAQVQASGVALRLARGERRCQRQDVPAGTASLRFFAKPFLSSGGPLDVTLFERGRPLTKGVLYLVRGDKPAVVRLDRPLTREVPGLRLCIKNSGLTSIDLAGDRTPVSTFITPPVGVQQTPDDVRVDFVRRGSESWWALAPVIAKRFFLEKASFFGPWTMWAVFVLVGLNCIAALFVLARELRPR